MSPPNCGFVYVCVKLVHYYWNFRCLTCTKVRRATLFYPGDINLGVIGYLFAPTADGMCGTSGAHMGHDVVQQPEAVYYAVDAINGRRDVLPNITLGFVFMDGCLSPTAGSARAVYFIEEPKPQCKHTTDDRKLDFPAWFNQSATVTSFTHYKVAGVIGPPSSAEALTVGALLSAFDIPVLGTFASSDQLSDERRFKYFSRLVPPDNFQTQAMVDVLRYFDWKYVSVLYAEGNYGENAAKQFTKWLKEQTDICIAFSYMIPNNYNNYEVKYIVDNLVKHKNAKVVALFASDMQTILQEVDNRNLTGDYIWFGSDTVAGFEHKAFAHLTEGTLYMTFEGVSNAPDFEKYFKELNPWNATSGNPYMVNLWRDIFKCNWDSNTSLEDSCYSHSSFQEDKSLRVGLTIGKLIDGVYVYAYALHDLITQECPSAFLNKTQLDDCITGEKLLTYIRNVSFQGVTGTIKFDAKGDILGAYSIVQIQYNDIDGYHGKQIGIWDKITENVQINRSLLQWQHRSDKLYSLLHSETHENLPVITSSPVSICSWDCPAKHYRVQQELQCCWLCKKCRDNEHIVKNNTTCRICPENNWPDDITATTCLPIKVSYLKPNDGISMGLYILGVLGLVSWAGTLIVFIIKREEKLIKACNRELTFLILMGALLALINVFAYVTKPTKESCLFREIAFHMSVNILFGPLLVKTNRVHRIFKSGKKAIRMPRFVTTAAQRVFTAILLLSQILVLVILEYVSPITPIRRMPVRSEKYVELVCQRTTWVFLIPMIYNIAMIMMCAWYGFRSRKLPQNFNESWFIFISVATTLFAWVVILPSYFNAFYAYHQEALLALCLIINVYICLLCQYGPKIYAIYWVDKEAMQVTMTFVTGVHTDGISQQYKPNSVNPEVTSVKNTMNPP